MSRHHLVFAFSVAVSVYFVVGGIGSYLLINSFDFRYADISYSIDVWTTAGYSLVALATFVLAYGIVSRVRLSSRPETRVAVRWAGSVQLVAVTMVLIVGLLGLVLMMAQYGGQVPAFAEGSDEFRTEVSSGLPQVLYFQLVTTVLIGYALLWQLRRSMYRKLIVILMLLALAGIFVGASRSMFFMPIVVLGIDLWRRRRLGRVSILLGLVVSGVLFFLLGLFRMGDTGQEGLYILRFIADFAPEFREFGKVIEYIPDKSPYLTGQMLINALFILLPGKLLALLEVSKAEYWQPFGMYLKNLFGYEFAGGGLRAGLIAELYANFGVIGILTGFLGLGGIAAWLDRKIRNSGDVGRMFFLVVGVSLATSLLFTFDAVVYKVFSLGLGWLLYRTLTTGLAALSASQETHWSAA